MVVRQQHSRSLHGWLLLCSGTRKVARRSAAERAAAERRATSWLAPSLQWDAQGDPCTRPLPRTDRQTGVDQARTLADALQAESRLASSGEVEPDAPVPHAQDQLSLVRDEPDGGLPALRVVGDVPQGLLRHAVETLSAGAQNQPPMGA